MDKFKYVGLLCALCIIGGVVSMNPICAHENDMSLNVKLNKFFDIVLPKYDQKIADCDYIWNIVYDVDHLARYTDTNEHMSFKALQKGRTIVVANLIEHNKRTNHIRVVKTVSYIINVK